MFLLFFFVELPDEYEPDFEIKVRGNCGTFFFNLETLLTFWTPHGWNFEGTRIFEDNEVESQFTYYFL